MDEAVSSEKIECSVHRYWSWPPPGAGHGIDDVVGPYGRVPGGDGFEDAATLRCQPQPALAAHLIGCCEAARDAKVVIVNVFAGNVRWEGS